LTDDCRFAFGKHEHAHIEHRKAMGKKTKVGKQSFIFLDTAFEKAWFFLKIIEMLLDYSDFFPNFVIRLVF
jgi:hypothetical protein